MKKIILITFVLLVPFLMGAEFGIRDNDPFQELFSTFFSDRLHLIIPLLGFMATFIVYALTHNGSVLFVGIIVALVSGGIVKTATLAFDAGTNSFESSEHVVDNNDYYEKTINKNSSGDINIVNNGTSNVTLNYHNEQIINNGPVTIIYDKEGILNHIQKESNER